MEVPLDYINGCVGVDLDGGRVADLLSRMALSAEVADGGRAVHVSVPPTRSDVLHACDVMEVR
jgi:phenylalanyl-tRNA synthetase beta chain